jgi:bleomycin hydrolase
MSELSIFRRIPAFLWEENDLMDVQMTRNRTISSELISKFSSAFCEAGRQTLMNAIKKNGIEAVAMNQDSIVNMQYTFSNEIKTGDITNQRQSGRCWMFAGLNTLRLQAAKNLNMETFELSQNYQMFWDKFEKANYFLESILEKLDEETDSRLVSWLLISPLQDGGQWDMFVNLVDKYGVVPKHVMPETFHSSKSAVMNRLVTQKLREDAARLRDQYRNHNTSLDELYALKEEMLNDVYQMLCHFLGVPPTRFDFEYRDKENDFHRDLNITPLQFYEKYVGVRLDDYVSIINAPTKDKPFNKTYTVKYLGNVKGGKDVLYLNVEIDQLRRFALAQLKDDEPVWFGCDVGKMLDRDSGIMDTNLYDYESALGVTFDTTKAMRLDYGESQMTHAMVFTGVNLVDGKPNRWKVENSWGTDIGNKGFFIMSDQWFDDYMYQIVVQKKYLPDTLLHALQEKPTELQPWDPMGSLAQML